MRHTLAKRLAYIFALHLIFEVVCKFFCMAAVRRIYGLVQIPVESKLAVA